METDLNLKELFYLIHWDMKINHGWSFDCIRAKLLLMDIRIEGFVYANLYHRNWIFTGMWYVVRFLGSIFQWLLCNSNIPGTVIIGRGLRLPHPQNIIITGMAKLGDFCMVYHNVTIAWNGYNGSINRDLSPRLGDCVLVGTGSVIIGDVIIGKNVIIGAGTVVARSIPDYHQIKSARSEISTKMLSKNGSEPGSKEHLNDLYSIWR